MVVKCSSLEGKYYIGLLSSILWRGGSEASSSSSVGHLMGLATFTDPGWPSGGCTMSSRGLRIV